MSYYGPGVTDPTGMARRVAGGTASSAASAIPHGVAAAPALGVGGWVRRIAGAIQLAVCTFVAISLLTWSIADPSLTHSASGGVSNWMGAIGAIVSDLLIQLLGIASIFTVLPPAYWALQLVEHGTLPHPKRKLIYAPLAVITLALAWSSMPELASMPLRHGYGGVVGDILYSRVTRLLSVVNATRSGIAAGLLGLAVGMLCLQRSFGLDRRELRSLFHRAKAAAKSATPPTRPNAAPALSLNPQPWDTTQQAPSQPAPAAHQPAWTPQPASPQPFYGPSSDTPNAQPPPWQQLPQAAQTDYRHAPAPAPAPATASHGPARQAWLRPMATRVPARSAPMASAAISTSAPEPDRLVATDRRHAPAFDRDTLQQSRAIAERFAPTGVDVQDFAHEPAIHIEPVLPPTPQPMRDIIPEPRRSAREPDIILPQAHSTAARHSTQHAPMIDRAVTVAPGGFFARLTSSQRGNEPQAPSHYKHPPLNLLHRAAAPQRAVEVTTAQLRDRSQQLLETLGDFGIKGDIVAVRPGPVVTLFEFEPARGTKSSRVIGLADDIARSMSARAVRIAVVPGVNAIGIELPNATREAVGFRELLETDAFRQSTAKLPLALGKGIGGDPVVADLTRMPHLLVAGTTGSGKSVGVNAMILSLLYQLSPDDCRMILIDPKMLELSVYNGIPHLLTPVVTDPNKAIAALNWAVGEMERRYKRMSALSVRNIEVYNTRVRGGGGSGGHRHDLPDVAQDDIISTPMPHIVIVVDEFADLMAVAGKEIEFAVQRLAQMARAAGIHLIMATQRPSVDIITGTIKANFPTRISFRVTSRIDSRTILNEQGAEQLLGQGDMLYAGGSGQVVRVHGPFVSDEEVEAIATYLRSLGAPAYVDGITDTPDLDAAEKTAEVLDEDHLYDRAVAIVRADQKASISYLQRKLSIGYNRSAGIVERMEQDGLISPPNASGKREILQPAEPPASSPID